MIKISKTFTKGFTPSSIMNKINYKRKNKIQIKVIWSKEMKIDMKPHLNNPKVTTAQVKFRGHQLAHSLTEGCKN